MFYGAFAQAEHFSKLPARHEHYLFPGIITALAGVNGLIAARRDPFVKVLGGVATGIILLTTVFLTPDIRITSIGLRAVIAAAGIITAILFYRSKLFSSGVWRFNLLLFVILLIHFAITGRLCLWEAAYDLVRPLRAIRAVSRAGLLLVIPIGLGVAITLSRLGKNRRSYVAAIVIGLFCMCEQITFSPSFSKQSHRDLIDRISEEIPNDAEIFYYSPIGSKRGMWLDQLDAMFVQLKKGIPSINGNLNVIPLLWKPLSIPNISSEPHGSLIKQGLNRWINIYPVLKKRKVIWVKVENET